jgi:4-hydroxy-tetrahydrodipicolinate reductase
LVARKFFDLFNQSGNSCAAGRVGRVLIDSLYRELGIKIVGAVDLKASGEKIVLGDNSVIPFSNDLAQIINATQPDVIVDFSLASATMPAVRTATEHRVNLVIGTTGLSAGDVAEIERLVTPEWAQSWLTLPLALF